MVVARVDRCLLAEPKTRAPRFMDLVCAKKPFLFPERMTQGYFEIRDSHPAGEMTLILDRLAVPVVAVLDVLRLTVVSEHRSLSTPHVYALEVAM